MIDSSSRPFNLFNLAYPITTGFISCKHVVNILIKNCVVVLGTHVFFQVLK